MTDRARASLGEFGVPVNIESQRVIAACPSAGIFLMAEYEEPTASFSALGRLGRFGVADIAIESGTPRRVRIEPRRWR